MNDILSDFPIILPESPQGATKGSPKGSPKKTPKKTPKGKPKGNPKGTPKGTPSGKPSKRYESVPPGFLVRGGVFHERLHAFLKIDVAQLKLAGDNTGIAKKYAQLLFEYLDNKEMIPADEREEIQNQIY